MDDLQKAIQLLDAEGYTCVLCRDDIIYTSRHRGVRPLMDLLGQDLEGFCAADKVVGRATALLYCLLKVRRLHSHIISDGALDVLQAHGIAVSWDTRVPFIVNREGNGRCPMELATQDIHDPALAPDAIRKKLKELTKEQTA